MENFKILLNTWYSRKIFFFTVD